MENPIPVSTRGKIYIASVIGGAALSVIGVILQVLGLNEWIVVVSTAAGALATVAGILGKSYLSEAPVDDVAPFELS